MAWGGVQHIHELKLTPPSCLLPGQTFSASVALQGGPWTTTGALHRSTSHLSVTLLADRALIHAHSWIFNSLLLQGYKRHIYSHERGAASLSLFALLLHLASSLSLFPPPLSTSLYMYNLNIGSKMQALISCACFISGVDQKTFFLWHLEQANTILHRLRERKIPFVLCQHKHFNLRLSLLSKQHISSEAQRDTGNACGSFNLSLISRGTPHSAWPLCFYQSARACISQKREQSASVSAYK